MPHNFRPPRRMRYQRRRPYFFRAARTTALSALASALAVAVTVAPGSRAARAAGDGVILPKGPLPVRNTEPTSTPFLLPLPTDASVLEKGRSRVDLNLDIPNTLVVVPGVDYYVDFEEQRLWLGYARGLGGGQELGIRVPYIWRNGGGFDWFIDFWHRTFRMGAGGRQFAPRQQAYFFVRDAQTGEYVISDDRARQGFGDAVLEYRRALTPGPETLAGPDPRRFSASARALLKLPTGSSTYLFGSGAADFGLGFAATYRPARRIALHGNVSMVWAGQSSNDSFAHRSTLVHSLISLEWMMDGRTSFLAQTDDSPAPHRVGSYYPDRARRAFTFGLWRVLSRDSAAYISLGENDFGFAAKHAPDVTLSAGTRFIL